MPKYIFDTCCGCIELKTGCFIIGYIQLVYEIIVSVIILFAMLLGGAVAAGAADMDKDNKEDTQTAGVALMAICVILLLIMTLLLAFTITLLVGLHKDKRGHVKAYLIYSAISLVLFVILFFASLFQSIPISRIFSYIFSILLNLYFILVIRSYYYKMDDANKGVIYNTA